MNTRAPYVRRHDAALGLEMGEALDRGLEWLFRTEQPPGAIVSHHGDSLPVTDNRRLSFIPQGSADGRSPVVVLDVARPHRRNATPARPLDHWGLAPQELDTLAGLLAARGYRVSSRWNGFPSTSGSVALGAAVLHPGMKAALDAYRKGCAMHGGTVFCQCPHWLEGFARLTPLRSHKKYITL